MNAFCMPCRIFMQVHESFVLSEMQSVVHAFRKGGARQADESG